MASYKGYALYYRGVDVFFVTSRIRKTRGLAVDICHALQIPDASPSVLADVLYYGWFGEATERENDLEIRNATHGGYGNTYAQYEERGLKPLYFLD
jgi:hypothetical protein